MQSVRGSEFADIFYGSNNHSGAEVFQGRGGNDFIDGGGGFDRVIYWFRTDDNVTGGINVNMAAGTVVGDASVGSRHPAFDRVGACHQLRRHLRRRWIYDDASNFRMPAAPDSLISLSATSTFQAAFNEFEGFGGNDSITGNGNTRISYINATRWRDCRSGFADKWCPTLNRNCLRDRGR